MYLADTSQRPHTARGMQNLRRRSCAPQVLQIAVRQTDFDAGRRSGYDSLEAPYLWHGSRYVFLLNRPATHGSHEFALFLLSRRCA